MEKTNSIKFELGVVNPRISAFDHHGPVAHADNFIVKMSAVQLLEAVVMRGINPAELEIEVNHTGHLDDICAFAIVPAAAAGKLRALYAFACVVSVLDSCGPSGYLLIQKKIKVVVDSVYAEYHRLVGAAAKVAGCQKWQLPIEKQIEASKAAGTILVSLLPEDDYEASVPDEPPADSYEIVSKEGDIWLVRVVDANRCNTIRFSGWFYAAGARVVVGYFEQAEGRWDYSISIRSPYDGDLSGVWPQLATREEIPVGCRNWGGHSGAGGSPMRNEKAAFPGGSVRTPNEVYDLVKAAIV